MLISELIKELEQFKEKNGDLPVYHSIGRVADVEIDTISYYGAYKCLIGNQYLDHYSVRVEDKIKEVMKDIEKYVKTYDITCHNCDAYGFKDDHAYCHYRKERLHFNERHWYHQTCEYYDDDYLYTCFQLKEHIKYEKLYNLLHYYQLLLQKKQQNIQCCKNCANWNEYDNEAIKIGEKYGEDYTG